MELDNIKKEIGLKIRTFRREKKLTQEQFSELVNIEQASLSNIENGKTYPTFSTVCNLIEKANIEPNYLFDFLYKNNSVIKDEYCEIITLLKKFLPSTNNILLKS